MMERLKKLGHKIYTADEDLIKETFIEWQDIIDCEPSSSIVFTAPLLHSFKKDEKVVFINSGKLKI